MSKHDDALSALDNTDWSGAQVVADHRPASTVYSVRLPRALAMQFEAVASRRGLTPTGLLKELAEAAVARGNGDDPEVTVRASDLHRLVDRLVVDRTRQAA